ncbi:SusC/RagA family TonB-linked outer membrane protein [Marivirga sp.]|uniref:SusC/RagA family TonB-linked outer membrane protein n=1 Tax=Marivirga sp. TaxID=2018662 RepID=UPI002D7E5F86|nr:SusC/RagA family TonB-linked outer membrane protein [Marivirga sp.]HET8858397.1 SusC/RagA family TonB-linked outer membrane protein [Marivirga sp.]
MKKLILILCYLLSFNLIAQNSTTYSSRVVDEKGEAIPGAVINEVGTERFAVTLKDGSFELKTPSENFTISVRSLGFKNYSTKIQNGQMPEKIILSTDLEQLDEVVVTALGIEREKQSLGSSITKVDSKALSDVPLTNIVNSLAGQVAGVQITNGSSGVGSSSRIIIRGENSLSGRNEPLFVVDGVPISNRQITSDLVNDGALQEVDYGNGAAEINPDDIASISILKGAGSAALYGARAANGVVLITTKRGQDKEGFGVSTSSLLTFETLLTLPDYQNEYGGGSNGEYAFQNGIGAGINDGGISSYGPRLDIGLLIPQFDSPSVDVNGNPVRAGDVIARTRADGTFTDIMATPWISRPDNVRNFFQTGITSQQNIAIHSSSEKSKIRLAYSNLRNEGILPNTGLERDGISLSLDQQLTNRISLNSFVNYINSRSENRPNLGYGYENVMYGFNWTGRNFNIASMKDYWQAGQEGTQHYDFNYLWLTNPYLTLFENTNSFDKNRLLGNTSLNFDITDKLSLNLRTGVDRYNDEREFRRAVSTNRNPFGSYREDNVIYNEMNSDLLLTYRDRINNDFKYSISAGANRFDQHISYSFAEASQLALPGIYSLANSRTPLVGNSQEFNKRINSIYGIGNISYKSKVYLDLTARNDWSSTLPDDFAYYSAGLSFVLDGLMETADNISFANVRLSAASVGNDTDPYQTRQTYVFNQNYGSLFRVTNETLLKNPDLKPERLNALEAGAEIRLFNDRLQFDFAGYQNTSIDQIISRPISNASGFQNKNENGGTVRTRGLEVLVSGRVINNDNIKWNSSVNFNTYNSVVTELPDDVSQYVTGVANVFGGSGGSNTVFYIARENGRVGDMYGSGFVEIEGETVYENGLPVQDGNLRLLGNYNPDFMMGWNNQVNFGNFVFSMLWDWRQGGTIVSRTKALGSTSGVLQETLVGRETGIIGEGVMNIGTAENPQFVANTVNIPASRFYNNFFDRGNEASALYDASYIKLRQLSLYYTLSNSFAERIGFQDIKIGFIGSNLLLFTENPHFDPELNALQETSITYGVEDMSYPSARSFGFSIKTNF